MVTHVVWWAGVASRAHLTYGISWIRELLRREPGSVELRMLGTRTFFGGDEITPDDVAGIIADAAVTVTSGLGGKAPKGAKPWLLSTGAVGIKPWLRIKARHLTRRVTVVVTDEGIGTYGNWRSRHQAMGRQGVPEPWRTIRTTAVEGATKLLTDERWATHVRSGKKWGLNKQVGDEFRAAAPKPDDHPGRVVFLSQAWPELGVLDEAKYAQHLDEVARAVQLAGREFVVLPHPGEPKERHERYAVEGPQVLAEFHPVALGAEVLVGASSTAMLNLAAVHGIPAIRVGTPELTKLDHDLAPGQASLLGQYAAPSLSPVEFGRRLSQGLGR